MKTTPLSLRLTVALHGALHSPNLGVVAGPGGYNTNSPYRPRLSTGDIISKLVLSATPQDVAAALYTRVSKNVPTPPYDKKTLCLVHPQVPAKLEELSSLTGLPKDGVLRLLLEDLVDASIQNAAADHVHAQPMVFNGSHLK